MIQGISEWSGERLSFAEGQRPKSELGPTAVQAAPKLMPDPEDCAPSLTGPGWLTDSADDILKKVSRDERRCGRPSP